MRCIDLLLTMPVTLTLCGCREAVHGLGVLRRPGAQVPDGRGADRAGAAGRQVRPGACQRKLTRPQDVRQTTRTIRALGGWIQTARRRTTGNVM